MSDISSNLSPDELECKCLELELRIGDQENTIRKLDLEEKRSQLASAKRRETRKGVEEAIKKNQEVLSELRSQQ